MVCVYDGVCMCVKVCVCVMVRGITLTEVIVGVAVMVAEVRRVETRVYPNLYTSQEKERGRRRWGAFGHQHYGLQYKYRVSQK